MADNWKTPEFRQTVVAKIEETIRQAGNPTTRSPVEMESHFFQRAKTKEEYLNCLAKILLHIRSQRTAVGGNALQQGGGPQQAAQPQMMNQMNIRPQMQQVDQQQQQQQQAPQQVQQQQPMMNPMQQQQQMMNQFGVNQQNMNMNNQLMQQLGGNQGPGPTGPGSVLVNQLSQPGMPAMGQNVGQQQQQTQQQQQQQQQNMNLLAAQRQRFAAVAAAKMAAQQQQQQQQPSPQQAQQQMINQQLLLQQQQQQQRKMESLQGQGPPTPQQFGTPSPAPMSMSSMVASSVQSQIGAPSPAFVQSPGNPQIASSPASAVGRTPGPPQQSQQQQQQQQQRVMMGTLLPPPSPSMTNVATPGSVGMLHTPQGAGMGAMQAPGMVPGPMGGVNQNPQMMNEDQLYLEKVRQLSRFIEPLTRLIARYPDEDSEKQSKMKIMLDILSNPNKRMPMDTLLKCEAVLEKMDFKRSETGSLAPPSVSSVPSLGVAVPGMASKDHAPQAAQLHPLLETIANQAKSPFINHTLRRTFSAAVDTLVGCDITPPPSVYDSEEELDDYDEMMDTLEREVANMDPRFKVSINPNQFSGVSSLQLICDLNDKFLPKVPPLSMVIPQDYPKSAPICPEDQKLYEASVFLRDVIEGLRCRISHLPARYSLSQVLHCWEMSLRNACKPQSSESFVSQLSVSWGF